MNVLVTAGNTQVPVDQVRCLTTIFSGRTGAAIAVRAYERGHSVCLLTSRPEVVGGIPTVGRPRCEPDWRLRTYRTFDDLDVLMEEELRGDRPTAPRPDVLIHAAAVSDYRVAGVFSRHGDRFADAAAGKVKSTYPELWLKLVPTPKLVDKVRPVWGFSGVLVKFKLEVGPDEHELAVLAEQARVRSGADLIVANTLAGLNDWALLGAGPGTYRRVPRSELPDALLDVVETLGAGRVGS